VMEGGDTGGYSHGVLKSMTNDKCCSLFHFIFIPGQLLSSVGMSFPYLGSCFQTWAVVFICGQLLPGGGGGWGGLMCCCSSSSCHVDDVAPISWSGRGL